MLKDETHEPTTGTLLVLSVAIAMLILFVVKAFHGQSRVQWWYPVFYLFVIGQCIYRIRKNRKAAEIKEK